MSFEEYKHMFKTNKGYCDYTGLAMSFNHSDPLPKNYVTLERIDEDYKIGYKLGNVCLVRRDVNKLKGDTLEKNNKSNTLLTPDQRIMLDKMCKTLYDPLKMKQIKDKYILNSESVDESDQLCNTVDNKETEISLEEKETMTAENVETFTNKEITIAENYAALGKMLEAIGAEFYLTYSEYKSLVSRKKCAISEKAFDDENPAVIWVINKAYPVVKDNCLPVTEAMQKALDKFTVAVSKEQEDMRTIAKNLLRKC